jgi:hypothetical protein
MGGCLELRRKAMGRSSQEVKGFYFSVLDLAWKKT